MDITKFYELRTRLYNTAAAGCMTVSEDFRLKRAVEDFKPLAAANKAFEKLYALCEKLFSEKPDTVLPDCIALAEALAVTQGTFADSTDNAETKPASGEWVSAQKPASSLAAVKELLRKSGDGLWKLSAEYKDTLRDPRIVTAFLYELENGKFNEHFQLFAEIMCEVCGKALVPGLKATVKSSGRQLQYIVRLSGDEENGYYRALAQDEGPPEKVRLAAVSALSCSLENGELLAELYNTGKAKVKAAALLAMAEMDAPEAEPIFEKLLENYEKNKKILMPAIGASGGKVCTEFARKHLMELLEDAEHAEGANERTIAGIELVITAAAFLRNKAVSDDIFLEFSAHGEYSVNVDPKNSCVGALMHGLFDKNSADVYARIDRLYAKVPDVFSRPKAFADFLKHPENEPAVPSSVLDHIAVIGSLTYIPMFDSYYLDNTGYGSIIPLRPICKRLPEWMTEYIRQRGDYAEKLFGQLDAPKREDMVKNAEKLGFRSDERKDALQVAFEGMFRSVNTVSMLLLRHFLPNCAREDLAPLKDAAAYFAKKCFKFVGGPNALELLDTQCAEIESKELMDILNTSVVNALKMKNTLNDALPLSGTIAGRFTRDELQAGWKDLHERVSALRGCVDDNIINGGLKVIDWYKNKI